MTHYVSVKSQRMTVQIIHIVTIGKIWVIVDREARITPSWERTVQPHAAFVVSNTLHSGRQGHSGLIVSTLDSGVSARGLRPGRGYCVMFLDKKPYYARSLSPPRYVNGYLRIYCLRWIRATETGISSTWLLCRLMQTTLHNVFEIWFWTKKMLRIFLKPFAKTKSSSSFSYSLCNLSLSTSRPRRKREKHLCLL